MPVEGSGLVSLKALGGRKYAVEQQKINNSIVPDVRGMGLKGALNLLEPMGLRVKANGSGKVSTQSLPAGSKIIKGQTIYLILGKG
jgi:cell division protein FtsI (penicillin-binding protein 3)